MEPAFCLCANPKQPPLSPTLQVRCRRTPTQGEKTRWLAGKAQTSRGLKAPPLLPIRSTWKGFATWRLNRGRFTPIYWWTLCAVMLRCLPTCCKRFPGVYTDPQASQACCRYCVDGASCESMRKAENPASTPQAPSKITTPFIIWLTAYAFRLICNFEEFLSPIPVCPTQTPTTHPFPNHTAHPPKNSHVPKCGDPCDPRRSERVHGLKQLRTRKVKQPNIFSCAS